MTTRLVRLALLGLLLPAASPAVENCFLWEARSATATVYLLGSMHVAKPDLYPLDPAIERAFKQSQTLVVEVNLTPENERRAAMLTLQRGIFEEGQTLDSVLKPETRALLNAHLAAKQIAPAQVQNLRPWMLGMTLAMRAYMDHGYSPEHGLDKYFCDKAGSKMEIRELETVESQLNLLSGFATNVQELILVETLKQLPEAEKFLTSMVAAWKSGDAAALNRLMEDQQLEDPALKPVHKALLEDRNTAMTAKVRDFLKTDKTYFVIVGSAHLAGEQGIVSQLRRTCTVRQVAKAGAAPATKP